MIKNLFKSVAFATIIVIVAILARLLVEALLAVVDPIYIAIGLFSLMIGVIYWIIK